MLWRLEMADANGYGYNSKGQWTILQPGEAEWDPSKALENIYGNDTTSLLGQYYQAGGNMSNTGGLMMQSAYGNPGTSIADNVYEYTRPYTDAENVANRNAQGEWQNMFLNSPVYNKNGANSYAIQSETYNPTRGNISDQSRWTNWATNNKYIQPAANTGTGANNTGANTGAPETRGQLPISTTPGVTNGAPTGGTPNPTVTSGTGRPAFKRSNSGSAFAGQPLYNQFGDQGVSNQDSGAQNYGGLGFASQQYNRSKGNWNGAIWS
jgi:hypothetical protein